MTVNKLLDQSIRIENYKISYRDFIVNMCVDKKVLHIGCFDYPYFSYESNLHLQLANTSKVLHGLDIEKGYEEIMKKYYDGVYYSSYAEINQSYEIVIVPEVLEHVRNPEQLLRDIFSVNTHEIFITAPNSHYFRDGTYYDEDNCIFHEIIHEDHKVWYSPYTLFNTVKPYIKESDTVSMYFLSNKSSVSIKIKHNENSFL